ncbi:hypothetical protein [Amycolatopsis sp. cmx-11-51]|uniref:hypothetical protein n=1 Tax=unclassified Amycolatopsis TaxID=2618356 RepID=UPI0039E6631E
MVFLLVLVLILVVLAAVGIGVFFLVKSNNKPQPPALPHHQYPQHPSQQQPYPPRGWGS